MKRYKILLILPNGGKNGAFEDFIVEATKFTIEGGVYYFWKHGNLYKTFPACYTLVTDIEEIPEKKK